MSGLNSLIHQSLEKLENQNVGEAGLEMCFHGDRRIVFIRHQKKVNLMIFFG